MAHCSWRSAAQSYCRTSPRCSCSTTRRPCCSCQLRTPLPSVTSSPPHRCTPACTPPCNSPSSTPSCYRNAPRCTDRCTSRSAEPSTRRTGPTDTASTRPRPTTSSCQHHTPTPSDWSTRPHTRTPPCTDHCNSMSSTRSPRRSTLHHTAPCSPLYQDPVSHRTGPRCNCCTTQSSQSQTCPRDTAPPSPTSSRQHRSSPQCTGHCTVTSSVPCSRRTDPGHTDRCTLRLAVQPSRRSSQRDTRCTFQRPRDCSSPRGTPPASRTSTPWGSSTPPCTRHCSWR